MFEMSRTGPTADHRLITGSGSSTALFSLPLAFKSRLISPSVPLKTAPAVASCYCTGFEFNPFALSGFLSCMGDCYKIGPYHLSAIIYHPGEQEDSDYTQRCLEYYPISLSDPLTLLQTLIKNTHIYRQYHCFISLFALHNVRNTITHRCTKRGPLLLWLLVLSVAHCDLPKG